MILKAYLSICNVFISIHLATSMDPLDSIILDDIIPSTGNKCNINSQIFATGQTTSHTFEYRDSPSTWAEEASALERDLFLAEISHVDEENQNRSWTLRVGQGGNIYSFRSGFGEAVAPQAGNKFVDDVFQSIAINQAKNMMSGKPYFIHQAGVYHQDRDFIEDAFFSPSIAKSCNEQGCSFGSWGQQSFVETFHKSDILYFNDYKDCGGGVIEVTSVIHNAATDLENGDDVEYLNVPWGGTRQSTLRDVFTSERNGDLKMSFPPKNFASGDGGDVDLSITGGYTVFAEKMIVPNEQYNQFPFQTPFDIRFIIDQSPSSEPSLNHNFFFEKDNCMCVGTEPFSQVIQSGCRDCDLWFTNSRTQERLYVQVVVYWAWETNQLCFCPDDITSDEFNERWEKGDEIIISYANVGKPIEENLALSFVHGKQGNLDQRWSTTRSRHGKTGSIQRDFTIFTINPRVQIKPGDTYMYQQYVITGEMSDMKTRSLEWVNEVYEDIFPIGEMAGTEIHLFSHGEISFGVAVSGDESCTQGINRCSGWTVPKFGMSPLFEITCGDKTYVGSNKYHFSPPQVDETSAVRSYVCDGEPINIKPKWKLLGFFSEGSCDYLRNSTYDPNFCSSTTSPIPSSSPTPPPILSVPTAVTSAPSTVPIISNPVPGSPSLIIDPVTTPYESNDEFETDAGTAPNPGILTYLFSESTSPSQSPIAVSRDELFNSFIDSILCNKQKQND